MLSFLNRLVRLFWRPETGTASAARIVIMPAAEPVMPAMMAAASIEIRPAVAPSAPAVAEQRSPAPARTKSNAPLFAARLQAVDRLNPPKTRRAIGRKPSPDAARKPKPKAAAPALKRRPDTKSGIMTARLNRTATRPSADIIDFAEARRTRCTAGDCAA